LSDPIKLVEPLRASFPIYAPPPPHSEPPALASDLAEMNTDHRCSVIAPPPLRHLHLVDKVRDVVTKSRMLFSFYFILSFAQTPSPYLAEHRRPLNRADCRLRFVSVFIFCPR
jgi:hypothetical protein